MATDANVRFVPFPDVDAPPLQRPRMRLAGGPESSEVCWRPGSDNSRALPADHDDHLIHSDEASAAMPLLLDYSSSGKE